MLLNIGWGDSRPNIQKNEIMRNMVFYKSDLIATFGKKSSSHVATPL